MDWLGSPALHFVTVIVALAIIGLGGYAYCRDRLLASTLALVLAGALAWIAYTIEGASSFLSLPGFVSDLLATIAGLSFVGLFLYWAYNREAAKSD